MIMAHIAPITPHAPISTFTTKTSNFTPPQSYACTTADSDQQKFVQRRNIALGLVGVVWGLSTGGGNAWGAARRPPPPPPGEKKDPNVTGLAAKVLASKKRKEAMKDTMAKLREKGKVVEAS